MPKSLGQEANLPNLLKENLKAEGGRLSSSLWRGHLEDFSYQDKRLSLNSNKELGRKLLFTTIKFDKSATWSGHVRLDKLPTNKNYAYILLSDLPQFHQSNGVYKIFEYLVLSIGGRERKGIALATLQLKLWGNDIKQAKVELDNDKTLLAVSDFPIDDSLDFDYIVSYDYDKAKLMFAVKYSSSSRWEQNSINWQELKPQDLKQSFGFLVNFSKAYQKAFHFSDLLITNAAKVDKLIIPDDNSKKKEDKPLKDEGKAVLITEVMPRPKEACAEYIELYNLNDKAVELNNYEIGIGSTEDNIRKLRLMGISIGAKSYLVLSKDPQAVLSCHSSCPKDLIYQAKLPQMNNKACYIFLYRDGQMIDGLYYNSKKLPKGFQSKKGVAWERSSLEHKELMTDISWHIGAKEKAYASAGLPNSKLSSENKTKPSESKEDELTIQELQQKLKEDDKLTVAVRIYDMMGVLLYKNEGAEARAYVCNLFSSNIPDALRAVPRKQLLINEITLINPKSDSSSKTLIIKAFLR